MTPRFARSWPCRRAAMPALAFLATAGIGLIAPLFAADVTLERSSPVILTSDPAGLPERRHPDTVQNLTTIAPTRAPNMTSPPALAARPNSGPDVLGTIGRAALAEAPPKNRRATRSIGYQKTARSADFLLWFSRPARRHTTGGVLVQTRSD